MRDHKIQTKKALLIQAMGLFLALGAIFFINTPKVSASTSIDLNSAKQGDYFFTKSGNTQYYYQIYDETDFFIVHVRLDSPYCTNSNFSATLNGETLTKKCDGVNNKYAWFYTNTKDWVAWGESESMLLRIDHPNNDHCNAEVYNIDIGSMSSFRSVSATAISATSISRTKLLADPVGHVLITIGDIGTPGTITTIEGGELWPGQEDSLAEGLLIIGSSTPGTNNTLQANFSSSAERGMALFDFIGYYSIGEDFPDFALDIGLSWPDPIYCTYSYNCYGYFNYTNMNFENTGTTTITWIIEDDTGDIVATTTLNYGYPFQEFILDISSTTGQSIGDIDRFDVSIGDVWSSEGRIIWIEEAFPTSFFPDCSASSVCPFLSGTSTISGDFVNIISCSLIQGGCFLFRPSEGTIDLFRRNANQAGGPYRNLGIIKEEIFSLASSTAPASSTFEIDLTEWGGRSFLVAESDEMKNILSESILNFLYNIIRAVFYFSFAVSLLVQITLMTRKKEEN